METLTEIPPQPEDFEDESGEVDWVRYYEACEDYELDRDGLR